MTLELLTSLSLFAVATSVTPGPNNAMLFASGLNHGIRRTLPHLLGVTLGFTFMQLALGLGVGYAFEALPALYPTLRALGVVYLFYLAWRIATATPPEALREQTAGTASATVHASAPRPARRGRPMTFLEASAFQWVNPKALMMCVSAASTYAQPESPVLGAFVVAGVFLVAGMPCVALWALMGSWMRGLLSDRGRLVLFNRAMAALLVLSMTPLLHEILADALA